MLSHIQVPFLLSLLCSSIFCFAPILSFPVSFSRAPSQTSRITISNCNLSFRAFQSQPVRKTRSSGSNHLYASSDFPSEDEDDRAEETLLRLHLSVNPGVDETDALEQVQRYTQSFPFAAILPVQPLQYLPTPEGGCEVNFLRKQTKEKGSVDGGVRFYIRAVDEDSHSGIDLVIKRNSEGQAISKMFTEKIIVQSYVQGISGESEECTGKAPTEAVSVESVFHLWL